MDRAEVAMLHFMHGYALRQRHSKPMAVKEAAGMPYWEEDGGHCTFAVYKRQAEEVIGRIEASCSRPEVFVYPGDDQDLVQSFKNCGFRQRFTEFLMQHPLKGKRVPKADKRVRRATTAEELQAMSKAKTWGRKFDPALLQYDNVHPLYIEDGGQVVAGCLMMVFEELGAIDVEDVFTVESEQGKGWGRLLMGQAMHLGKKAGMEACSLIAFAEAQAFYHRIGFETLAEVKFMQAKKR